MHSDDTTPIPRPSHYYGRRHGSSMKEFFPKHKANMEISAPPAPTALDSLVTNRIDKSQLALAEPRRLREKAHLKFVASQPCLICGRQPSDPHHLRYAQPTAIGLKVSDEFTVPPAAVIIGSCIRQVMRRRGGPRARSLRCQSPRIYGPKRVCRKSARSASQIFAVVAI